MRTLVYLSTLCLSFLMLSGCADKPSDGTFVTMFLINKDGVTQEGREVYVFKELKEGASLKEPSDALDVKISDEHGMVQFNLEDPDLFQTDESAVFWFRILEFQDGDFVTLAYFEKEMKPGDIVNQTLTLQ